MPPNLRRSVFGPVPMMRQNQTISRCKATEAVRSNVKGCGLKGCIAGHSVEGVEYSTEKARCIIAALVEECPNRSSKTSYCRRVRSWNGVGRCLPWFYNPAPERRPEWRGRTCPARAATFRPRQPSSPHDVAATAHDRRQIIASAAINATYFEIVRDFLSATHLNIMNEAPLFWEDAVFVERDEILEYNEANIIAQDNDTIATIRSWLRPTDFNSEASEYRKHLSSHLPGTGAWVLGSSIYQQWHESSKHGLLWVRGIPGSGKSVLAARMVHDLSQEQVPVLYFFFRQIVDANHKPRAALQDWLTQVLPYSPPLQLHLKTYIEDSCGQEQRSSQLRELDSVSMSDLWQHLRTALSHMSKAYLVVDALDEMDQGPQAEAFLQNLSELACWRPSQVKILMTSRPVANIKRSLSRTTILGLKMDEGSVDQDISAYVDSRLEQANILPEYYTLIQAAVPGKAKGLFLYAKLAMDALAKDGVDISQVLDEIPENLSQMYTQLLSQHAASSGIPVDEQQIIMQWMTYSVRSLRLIELADILSHQHMSVNGNLKAAKGVLRSACGSLLELLPDETLCVVHHSLTEFLTGEVRMGLEEYPILEPQPTHYQLALMCLAYLRSGCLEGAEPRPSPYRSLFAQAPAEPLLAPFAKYAAMNWSTHALRSGQFRMAEMNSAMDEFTAHPHFQIWAHVAGLRKDAKDIITPISMAIELGLSGYLRHLLAQSNIDINERAPTVSAAAKGFADVVDLLVKSGANVDQYDTEGYTALHRAAMNNHPAIISLLLQAGCDMDLKTTTQNIDRGFSNGQYQASWYACSRGHSEALTELQKSMKTSHQVRYALKTAVEYKRTNLVRRLLNHPLVELNPHKDVERTLWADSTTSRDRRNAPLVLACDNRDMNTIELLLAAGADANLGALHALARSRAKVDPDTAARCFSLVIGAAADLNAPEYGDHKSPLHCATDAIAAKLLLEAGADVEAQARNEETPVFTCVDAGVLKVLVEVGGANLEKRNRGGRTPLLASMHMSLSGRKTVAAIMALVDLGADVRAVDKEGNGVFHYAIKEFRTEFPQGLIERFCAAGADINQANNRGEAPIHLTKIEIRKSLDDGDFSIPKRTSPFEALVAAGARLSTAAGDVSRNPLFEWISKSVCDANESELPDVKKILVQYGAPLGMVDDKGSTLLHAAVRSSRHKAQITFLLGQGLDPHAVDHSGNTLWHEAVSDLASVPYRLEEKPAEPFEQLTQMGVNPMQPNNLGRIPLHILGSSWPSSIHDFKRSSRNGIDSGHANVLTAFDLMLSLSPEVNIADKDGVTPLHLACTLSEFLVGRLLSRGADPCRVTKEGCNAIHLAARARRPNIVGMLLSASRVTTASALVSAITAKDHLGRSPLYYACLAGSYESAQFLLEAGGTIDIENYLTSPWRAIARFEMESLNANSLSRDQKVGAVLIAHDGEAADQRIKYFGEEKLGGLVALLSANSVGSLPMIDQAILDASSFDADYTVERLLAARDAAHPGKYKAVDPHVIASIERRRAKREDIKKPCKNCTKVHHESSLQLAMVMDDHESLPDALAAEKDEQYRRSNLRRLVSNGEASALSRLVTLQGPDVLDDRSWGGGHMQKRGLFHKQEDDEPLLLRACRGATPNLDTIRVLVEQAQQDINTQQYVTERQGTHNSGLSDTGRYIEGECALHALVRGEHWWHVNQGLRYFLERGADTELRDAYGMTPLNASLNRCGWLIFDKTAVKLLVQHGADVNTADRKGHSCLAKACTDPEMTNLLLDHGAVITSRVLVQAIELIEVDLLRTLLSRGGNPNLHGESEWENSISPEGRYPLHHAIMKISDWRHSNPLDQAKLKSMIATLLNYGADPCAAYTSTTILHELVLENRDLTLVFTSPNTAFDIDVRNAAGETPLHLVCKGSSKRSSDSDKQSAAVLLVSHGADIRSKNREGNTIWHIFSETGAYGHSDEELQFLLQSAPDLINTPNKAGVTPLHVAMKCILRSRVLDLLIDNGGNLHALDGNGDSLLHCLLRNNWTLHVSREAKSRPLPFFTRLLDAGLDLNHRNKDGETPVFSFFRHSEVKPCSCSWKKLAAMRKAKAQSEMTGFLGMEPKGDENAQTQATTVETFLDQHVYDILTSAGVDWHVVNARGQNVLHIIAGLSDPLKSENGKRLHDQGQDSLAKRFKAMIDLGVDAGLEDMESKTPLDIAAALGHEGSTGQVSRAIRGGLVEAGDVEAIDGAMDMRTEEGGPHLVDSHQRNLDEAAYAVDDHGTENTEGRAKDDDPGTADGDLDENVSDYELVSYSADLELFEHRAEIDVLEHCGRRKLDRLCLN
ncbi:hypothetical protein OPT61_g5228 [Boeremia exigua]|uniref:Uncharacterized protein n=1 Tax=Boeremia exigua TaxID=749465 RepID=A0ACC2IB84_9PLEO|nr:hypothetical protein OPT61_g5228 [Boeremia exigua]